MIFRRTAKGAGTAKDMFVSGLTLPCLITHRRAAFAHYPTSLKATKTPTWNRSNFAQAPDHEVVDGPGTPDCSADPSRRTPASHQVLPRLHTHLCFPELGVLYDFGFLLGVSACV
jgi:hypothetical protein